MFLLCRVSDGRCWVIERLDDLDEAQQKKYENHEERIILVRLKGGYFVVEDDGTCVQFSEAKGA